MHVITATSTTQGSRDDDFCFTIEGELVRVPFLECATPDTCGCGRSFAGMSSQRATTTAIVVDRHEFGLHELSDLFCQDWLDQGLEPGVELRSVTAEEARLVTGFAADLPVGTVVERHGDIVRVRALG